MFATLPRLRITFASLAIASSLANPLWGYTKSGSVYTTDGSQSDVSAAIANATVGDTVSIPAGKFTWGTNNTFVSVNKAITLTGTGPDTVIELASTGPTWTAAVIRITAAATVRDFTINSTSTTPVTPLSTSVANGWRITGITFNGIGSGYFCYVGGVYGLIDSNIITGGSGAAELIFGRGPTNSWQTQSSLGTADAVYIESNHFHGSGYVCDANSNARFVVRSNIISGMMKVDAHGVASNTPPRSARHMEVYDNTWSLSSPFWRAMELRGGTGMIFNNIAPNAPPSVSLTLTDYGVTVAASNFNKQYQTPIDYPIADQIGVGMDPKIGGSEPMYLWNNRRSGALWPIHHPAVPAGAITRYQEQTGNLLASFSMQDVIAADRDYFNESATFNGTGGVGVGTKAQMLAIKPTKTGVGFWVTDESDWNSERAGPDGQLYTWTGSAWALKYTPYAYPHPLRGGPSTPPSQATVKILVTPKQ